MADPISREMALRIGLAARALPDTGAGELLRILEDAVGLPPTPKKLGRLTVKKLRAAAESLAEVDGPSLEEAVAFLTGERALEEEALPEVQPYAEGDLPGSVRVACASNRGDQVDGHFGSCARFLVYQVSAEEARLIDVRTARDGDAEDKNAYRAGLIADCQLLYVMSIGGPPAAKVIKAGVHPIKRPAGGSAATMLEELRSVLDGAAPPWLAKVMGRDAEARARFRMTAEG